MMRIIYAGFIAAVLACAGLNAAQAQTRIQTPQAQPVTPHPAPGRLVAASPDLIPIPSRIEHGVVSVRNAGAAASQASIVTVNCHRPGQAGGCVDIPAAYLAQYTNPAYPNRLVVQVPAIQAGHVYNHNLPFWNEMTWPSGQSFVFEYVADASNTNGESNEGNNAGSHTWNVP